MKNLLNSRTYYFGLLLVVVGGLCVLSGPRMRHRESRASQPLQATAPIRPAVPAVATASATTAGKVGQYGKLPLSFEANQGQTDKTVNFLARGKGYSLFLAPTEATFVMTQPNSAEVQRSHDQRLNSSATTAARATVLRMQVVGGNAAAEVKGDDELAGKVNYFIGNDPAQWRTNIPTFGQVQYAGVYPGVDLVYYGNQRQLEYDFVVAPGKDARAIALEFAGAKKVTVEAATGDLLLQVGENTIRQQKPLVYQDTDGGRREVEGRYAIRQGGQVGFEVGNYDPSAPLIIDPVLLYSTYLGGNGSDDAGLGIAVDSAGNAYVSGTTNSTNFPTANALQGTPGGSVFEAFVTKFNASGSALVYSTYLGGNGEEQANGIAVDSAGNAYITGSTDSTNFPTVNAIQGTFGGGLDDAFVTKLNAAGSALVYSTYLGGSGNQDEGLGIAIDSSGSAYVTGFTSSTNFPTTNPMQGTSGGNEDAFVTKLNAAGSARVYSTYLGGSAIDVGNSIAVDSAGNAYITGNTDSTNFPTTNAFQGTKGAGPDAFVTKLNAAGSARVYSTYLGGSGVDGAASIAVDAAGNAYVTGTLDSTNFPTANAIQGTFGGGPEDAFVTKLNVAGSALVYSTYLGGSSIDNGAGIAVDSAGNAYVTGYTGSTNFPTATAIQGTLGGGPIDAFVTKLNAAGSALVYSTYLGGSGSGSDEAGDGIAVDSAGNAYVTGFTNSTNFPTANAFQGTHGAGRDGFVTKIGEAASPSPSPTPSPVVNTVQFSLGAYSVQEDYTEATLTVTRTGDTSGAASVDYQTSDSGAMFDCGTSNGLASQRCDFTTASGTVSFAATETSKTFTVLINEDSYLEGPENFSVSLSNSVGAVLGSPATATVTITDDASEAAANPIDSNDSFVHEHYHDFLSRQADTTGLNFWVGMITNESTRIDTSKSFFDSQEFSDTGFFVYRLYRASFGNLASPNQTRANVTYSDFMNDRARVIGGANVEQLRQALADAFVLRARFFAEYPVNTNAQYVNHLFDQASLTPFTTERQTEIDAMTSSGRTRAQVLRNVVEIQALKDREKNPAFVLMQYFGYLRRDPDQAGYDFWLSNINTVNRMKGMVCAFITSREYQERFGGQVTRSNAQCNTILTSPEH